MRIKSDDLEYPILIGYPSENGKQLAVWCPYCVRYQLSWECRRSQDSTLQKAKITV